MPEIEDELKVQNWLSVLTFDAFKYAKAGGRVQVEWTDAGLVLRLPGVQIDSEGVNSKLRGMAPAAPEPPPSPTEAAP